MPGIWCLIARAAPLTAPDVPQVNADRSRGCGMLAWGFCDEDFFMGSVSNLKICAGEPNCNGNTGSKSSQLRLGRRREGSTPRSNRIRTSRAVGDEGIKDIETNRFVAVAVDGQVTVYSRRRRPLQRANFSAHGVRDGVSPGHLRGLISS